MKSAEQIMAALAEPFAPEIVSWRVQGKHFVGHDGKAKGSVIAYVDARDVQDRLNNVLGHTWQNRYPIIAGNNVVICEIGLLLDGEWVWRSDGAGETDYEGEKGSISDAFKRAAVKWGIGRYLYDIKTHNGKMYVADVNVVTRSGKDQAYICDYELPRLAGFLPSPTGYKRTGQAKAPRKTEQRLAPFQLEVERDADGNGAWHLTVEKAKVALSKATTVDEIKSFVDYNLGLIQEMKLKDPGSASDLRDFITILKEKLQ